MTINIRRFGIALIFLFFINLGFHIVYNQSIELLAYRFILAYALGVPVYMIVLGGDAE